jgi:hypothetical protein
MFLEHGVYRVTAKYTTGEGWAYCLLCLKFEFMILLEASVSNYNMPFQHLPDGTEKENKKHVKNPSL